jgi:hypothetical protein
MEGLIVSIKNIDGNQGIAISRGKHKICSYVFVPSQLCYDIYFEPVFIISSYNIFDFG